MILVQVSGMWERLALFDKRKFEVADLNEYYGVGVGILQGWNGDIVQIVGRVGIKGRQHVVVLASMQSIVAKTKTKLQTLCTFYPFLDPIKVSMQQMTCDFYKSTMEKTKSELE